MFVEIGNAPIYVKEQGEGDDALLLHGVPDSAELWQPLMDKIGPHYKCSAPDLPGMYRSGIPDNFVFDLNHYADFVDQLVTELGLQTPLTLIMHDWGGIYGMLWACKYPHKVKRIVGGDFPFSHLYKWHEWATVWRTPVLGELSMLAMNWPLFKWELKRSSRRLSESDMWSTYKGRVTKLHVRRTVLRMYRSANPEYFSDWLSRQKALAEQVPVDLIWGEDDPYVPDHQAQLIQSRSLTLVPNCGHWVPQEAPEEFAKVLLGVLENGQFTNNTE